MPTGIKPKRASKQKPAIPSASVTSTSENPGTERRARSHSVNFNISAEAGQLNRTIGRICQRRRSRSMCLLKAYLNDGSHFVIIILRPAFAARAELDHFAKKILCGSFGNR